MKNHFTFIQSPEITALNYALELMPGLMQVDLLVKNDLKSDISVFRLQEKDGDVQKLKLDQQQKSDSLIFARQQKNLSWYQNSDIPYIEKHITKNNSDLFTELDNNVLVIPIKSFSLLPQLIYIFLFRKNASELGPVSAQNVLDTSHKQLIGRLLLNSLKAMLHSILENRKVMLEYNKMLGGLINSKQTEVEEQKEKTSEYEKHLDSILETQLNALRISGEEISIPGKSKQILYPYLSQPDYLKAQLLKALNFARTFNFLQSASKLELLPEYFDELKKVEHDSARNRETNSELYSSHTKTYQFLQSLEEAAYRILQKGTKLTSINVGQELDQPVTAAAISDKLKNHAYKIQLLLKQYPDKWPVVRNQFRPVINIQEKQSREKFAS